MFIMNFSRRSWQLTPVPFHLPELHSYLGGIPEIALFKAISDSDCVYLAPCTAHPSLPSSQRPSNTRSFEIIKQRPIYTIIYRLDFFFVPPASFRWSFRHEFFLKFVRYLNELLRYLSEILRYLSELLRYLNELYGIWTTICNEAIAYERWFVQEPYKCLVIRHSHDNS